MKFCVRVLRWLSKENEDQRMRFRREVQYAEAHCEHLLRQIRNGHDTLAHKENKDDRH